MSAAPTLKLNKNERDKMVTAFKRFNILSKPKLKNEYSDTKVKHPMPICY
jgi:hypothetical protein